MKITVVLITLLKLAYTELSFFCHSSFNNGFGMFNVTGKEACDDYSFNDHNNDVVKHGEFINGQTIYEFPDCNTNITFVCNTPSRKTADCKSVCTPKPEPIGERSGNNSTADSGGPYANTHVWIVLGVIVIIVVFVE